MILVMLLISQEIFSENDQYNLIQNVHYNCDKNVCCNSDDNQYSLGL